MASMPSRAAILSQVSWVMSSPLWPENLRRIWADSHRSYRLCQSAKVFPDASSARAALSNRPTSCSRLAPPVLATPVPPNGARGGEQRTWKSCGPRRGRPLRPEKARRSQQLVRAAGRATAVVIEKHRRGFHAPIGYADFGIVTDLIPGRKTARRSLKRRRGDGRWNLARRPGIFRTGPTGRRLADTPR
ncbi:hypothetical protein D3C80_1468590 [compost metagenome]